MPVAHELSGEGPTQASPGVCEPAHAGHKHLLLMDHFSGMPLYEKMGISTDNKHTVRQLKRWFATFSVSRSIRCDNGPPFFSRGFKEFCDKYCIWLELTSPYNPESSGAAECGAGLIKQTMKKTKEERVML